MNKVIPRGLNCALVSFGESIRLFLCFGDLTRVVGGLEVLIVRSSFSLGLIGRCEVLGVWSDLFVKSIECGFANWK